MSALCSITKSDPLEWGFVNCTLCGTNNTSFSRRRTYHQLQCELVFNHCRNCDLLYLNPRPTKASLMKLYSSQEYFQGGSKSIGYSDYLGEEAFRRTTARVKLRRIEKRLGRKGRLLEIGCASGFFMAEARNMGWQVVGIDISKPMIDYAREKFSLEAYDVSLEEIDFHTYPQIRPGLFDVVVCWGTTGTFTDPLGNFKKIHLLLKEKGLFIFNATDFLSTTASLLGNRWFLYGPSSSYIYSRKSLRSLLKRSGFQEEKIRRDWCHLTLRKLVSKLPVLLGRQMVDYSAGTAHGSWADIVFPFPNFGLVEVTASKD